MILLSDLTKRHGRQLALSGVSLRVEAGESVALMGPSGSGKTTLLSLVAGLLVPDAGEVWIAGRRVSHPGWVECPAARGAGMVFQRPALWPHLSVKSNVTFGLKGRPRPEIEARWEELATVFGLHALEMRRPDALSGGEGQRVALARALAARPRLLLLDEPFAHLDEEMRVAAIATVARERESSGATLLLAVHDGDAAARLCTRVLRLRGGRLARDDVGELSAAGDEGGPP